MAMALTIPRYTVADLEEFPDDGNRYELLDGMLLVTPAPSSTHQEIAARLVGMLHAPLVHTKRARVFAPGVVTRPPLVHLKPDVLVVPPHFPTGTPWAEMTEHWLAVEIFSPSSRVYDRDFKRDAYIALGVKQGVADRYARKNCRSVRQAGAGRNQAPCNRLVHSLDRPAYQN